MYWLSATKFKTMKLVQTPFRALGIIVRTRGVRSHHIFRSTISIFNFMLRIYKIVKLSGKTILFLIEIYIKFAF